MTKEEWKQVSEAAESLFRCSVLNVDGYELTICLVRVSAYKNAIAIYVNGVFKDKWLADDCEERKRFVQRRKRRLITGKEYAKMVRGMKKKDKEDFDKRNIYEVYQTHWSSFGALKKHLIANNESIELIKIK
ncbi:MAG: hypothetical protein IJX07_06195 [Bacillales bacterium]|nr:hypothetical protein [Bacillales bacterium]